MCTHTCKISTTKAQITHFRTQISLLYRTYRQKLNKEIKEVTEVMTQVDFTDIMEYSTQTQKNLPSFKHLMEPSQKLTT